MNLILPERFKLALPDGLILKPRRPAGLGFGGEYRFVILDGATGMVKRETDWMPNLVTNHGLDSLGGASGVNFGGYCRIGTGNTAPANTDTALVAQSASTTTAVASSQTNAGAANYETKQTATYQFALGAVVGNMAEIGVGWTSAGLDLNSRALIVDGGGSPTTITVLVTEILQVVYRFTCYPNLTDATGTVTIGGVSYNYVSRVFSAASVLGVGPTGLQALFGSISANNAYPSTSTLGATTASGPTGSSSAMGGASFAAYTNGNYYRDYTVTAAIADANAAGGIAVITNTINAGGGGGVFNNQISFSSVAGSLPIPKDNTKALSITLRQFFSRHP